VFGPPPGERGKAWPVVGETPDRLRTRSALRARVRVLGSSPSAFVLIGRLARPAISRHRRPELLGRRGGGS